MVQFCDEKAGTSTRLYESPNAPFRESSFPQK